MSGNSTRGRINPVWWIVAAIVVIGLIAGGIGLGFALAGKPVAEAQPSSAPTVEQSEGAPATPATTTPPGSNDECSPGAASVEIPAQGPEANWAPEGYFFYPISDVFGPLPGDGDWACFDRSPTGALFAAASLFTVMGTPQYEAALRDAAVPSPELDAYLASTDPSTRSQTAGKVAQIAGFQFVDVSDATVTVNLGFQQDEVFASLGFTFVWDDSARNWKVDMSVTDFVPVLAEPTAFTPWSASGD